MSEETRSGKCGPHTEMFQGPALRVTRCGCGTFHVTLTGSGVTVRMNAETFKNVAAGLRAATERVEATAVTSTCIN